MKNYFRTVTHQAWFWCAAFLLTRAAMVAVWRYRVTFIIGDVGYYWTHTGRLPSDGIASVMPEYPTPVVWGLASLRWISGGGWAEYAYFFAISMALLDAIFAFLLWRHGGSRRRSALFFWILFVPLVGPLLFFRFDLLPAVLAGGGILLLRRYPRIAGALVGLGAATKLWPALLIAPLAAAKKERRHSLSWFAIVGFGLAFLSLIFGGWSRLISPLTWQKSRGLQVESLAATPLMTLRTYSPHNHWEVFLSQYNAFEITGPGTKLCLTLATLFTVLGMVVIGVLCWRIWHISNPSDAAIGIVMLAIVAIMIVTNKTLSPQYIIWLAGPLAVLLLQPPKQNRQIRSLAIVSLAIALGTQLIYPFMYDTLVQTPRGTVLATGILVARNITLLLWTIWLCWVAFTYTAKDNHPDSDQIAASSVQSLR
ncbi:MAG: glycosyltransferase 87 family protein [Propionibacteriaceae bacterium]